MKPRSAEPVEVFAPPQGGTEAERLSLEVERLQGEVKELNARLKAAQGLLQPKWAEVPRLLVVFGEAPAPAAGPEDGDPLRRFRPMLEAAPREAIRAVAEAAGRMGRATTAQLAAAAPQYSRSTVKQAVTWLVRNGVLRTEGKEKAVNC